MTEINSAEVKRLLLRVYNKYSKGDLTDIRAYREAYILNSVLKAIEVTDLETRLYNIEKLMKTNE